MGQIQGPGMSALEELARLYRELEQLNRQALAELAKGQGLPGLEAIFGRKAELSRQLSLLAAQSLGQDLPALKALRQIQQQATQSEAELLLAMQSFVPTGEKSGLYQQMSDSKPQSPKMDLTG